MQRIKPLEYLAVFLSALIWFAVFMPWNGFIDPDAFYHAKAAALLWQHGPLMSFPWLDLTILGRTFADQHFLFHAAVAPFSAAFGMFLGLRIASVIFAAAFLALFYAVLRGLKLPAPWLWSVLLALTQPALFRLILSKASPLALLLYVCGLYAAWRKRYWLLALIAFVFALTHGGFLLLVGSLILLMAGAACYEIFVAEKSWRAALGEGYWKSMPVCLAGVAAGLLIHPNRDHILEFLWYQAFVIGLGTPLDRVAMGSEWYAPSVSGIFSSFALWVCVAGVGLIGMFIATRRPLEQEKAKLTVALAWVLAVFVALSLKSRRNVEYLAPILALWCAVLWSHVDADKLFRDMLARFAGWKGKMYLGFAGLAIVALFARGVVKVWTDAHPALYPDEVYAATLHEISRRAASGDRVFHASWDEFPMLFAADDRLRYVSGLDPTFLYAASSSLSDAVRDATWENSTSTADERFALLHELDAKFIFASKKKHPKFIQAIAADARYERIADNPDSVAFEVR
jgi:hypothetical protein